MDHAFCAPGAPIGLTDRGKSRSCERAEARRGKILDVADRGATKARDANPRFPDGSQTDWCSSRSSWLPVLALGDELPPPPPDDDPPPPPPPDDDPPPPPPPPADDHPPPPPPPPADDHPP